MANWRNGKTKIANWVDEIILIQETEVANRVNKNGFPQKPKEKSRTVFCNKKSVGYSEYFKSQQIGKVVEGKYEVHKVDYEGENTVEIEGKRFFVLKTYEIDNDIVEITITDIKHKSESM
jgi:hypothetical protein